MYGVGYARRLAKVIVMQVPTRTQLRPLDLQDLTLTGSYVTSILQMYAYSLRSQPKTAELSVKG